MVMCYEMVSVELMDENESPILCNKNSVSSGLLTFIIDGPQFLSPIRFQDAGLQPALLIKSMSWSI